MELTAQELFWLYRAFGQARAGATIADAEHRLKIRGLCEFTEEERVAIGYQEIPRPDGNWGFQFQPQAEMERTFTERQKQKTVEVITEILPTLSVDQYVVVRGALLKMGWRPPQEEEDDGEQP